MQTRNNRKNNGRPCERSAEDEPQTVKWKLTILKQIFQIGSKRMVVVGMDVSTEWQEIRQFMGVIVR